MSVKRTSIITIFLFAWLAAGPLGAIPHSYPRVANFYTTEPHIEDCPRLSRYDMVIMPAGMYDIRPEIITTLRELNPDIILLAYFPAAIMWPGEDYGSPIHDGYRDKVVANNWWLRDNKGNKVGNDDYWWLLNFTTKCPRDSYGRTLAEWLPSYMADQIWATGVWDGLWVDECWDDPTWLNYIEGFFQDWPAMVDSDMNGVGDDPDDLLLWWRTAMTSFVSSLRWRLGDEAVILGNGKQLFHTMLNGGIRENFPRMHGDWEANMFSEFGYVTNCEMFRSYPMNASMMSCFSTDEQHTVFEPYRTPTYLRFLRFTLTSSLLGDGYLALENKSGRCLWWEDLYDIDLGNPTSSAYLDSILCEASGRNKPVWRRDFEKGEIVCNPYIQHIMTEDGDWIMPEDGLILITESDAPLALSALRDSVPGVVDRDVIRMPVYVAVDNPSDHAAPAYVWSVVKLGDTEVSTGTPREFLIGKNRTDTLSVAANFPSTLAIETYTIEVNVAGPDMEVRSSDTVSVKRTVEFPSEEETLADNHEPGSDEIEEDNLLIYPQPAAFSSGETLRMEVRGNHTSANENCLIRMYDVSGRLVRTIYEGVYGDGLSLEIGLTSKGGGKIAPGLYILVLELGDLAQTRKIVLLK